ncbi:hypothetical protein [Lachnoclostridium phytofermentans]|uniref:hypothetical protein n=1 Tax=Lachnoclostridium phytofermentans TaxID=66219 RepID=UPI000495EF86|nr:hypothetical protein [Lachnoclostridium phytofermentans]
MKKEWIEVVSYEEEGYQPLIDYGSWRVAILNYCDELLIEQIGKMQKHNKTDEVFVLLEGECTLFTGGMGDSLEEIDVIFMEPNRIYNIKKGVWHTHTLNQKGKVLIVENQDTSDENSPTILLNLEQKGKLRKCFEKITTITKSMV